MLMAPQLSGSMMALGMFVYVLVIATLVLSIVALWKYVTKK